MKFDIVKEAAEVLKSDLACNFSVSIVAPFIVATVHAKTVGIVSL